MPHLLPSHNIEHADNPSAASSKMFRGRPETFPWSCCHDPNLPAILKIIQELWLGGLHHTFVLFFDQPENPSLWSSHIFSPQKKSGGTVSYIIIEVKSPIFHHFPLPFKWQWFSYPVTLLQGTVSTRSAKVDSLSTRMAPPCFTIRPAPLPRATTRCGCDGLVGKSYRRPWFSPVNITQMLHVWNMFLHFPQKNGPNVGRYSIHGASEL